MNYNSEQLILIINIDVLEFFWLKWKLIYNTTNNDFKNQNFYINYE